MLEGSARDFLQSVRKRVSFLQGPQKPQLLLPPLVLEEVALVDAGACWTQILRIRAFRSKRD